MTEPVTITLSRGVTGRDGYILQQALFVAAKLLLAKPFPEESNAEDMLALLEAVWPGAAEQENMLERLRDGVAMGLKPTSGMSLTMDGVEAWITAQIAERDPPEDLLVAAIEEATEATGILVGVSHVRGVSEHDAREALHRANATIRLVSGRRLVGSPVEA